MSVHTRTSFVPEKKFPTKIQSLVLSRINFFFRWEKSDPSEFPQNYCFYWNRFYISQCFPQYFLEKIEPHLHQRNRRGGWNWRRWVLRFVNFTGNAQLYLSILSRFGFERLLSIFLFGMLNMLEMTASIRMSTTSEWICKIRESYIAPCNDFQVTHSSKALM